MLACEAAPQEGWTPLLYSSNGGHTEVVEALLAKGANVHTTVTVSIARARAFCPSRSLTHMQNAHGYL
jgi:ankyrin repeat protein